MKHLANHVTTTQEMLGRTLPSIIIGAVFFMSHNSDCVERFRLEGPFHSFLLNFDPHQLTIIYHDMILNQFSVTYDGQTNQTSNINVD